MKNDGGPAFPIGSGDMRDPTGMSLRDYLAGQVITGLFANSSIITDLGLYKSVIECAYKYADAMLKAREDV
ncbi:MAG: hypothetical protein EOM12_11800 [Verrucomicrobiae bacterium]|nr:hypothetical protein [Verrucomicrobiae bacterium]